MKYRYLLIDNDNTLMDFHAAEHAALREALTEAGIEPTDAVCARYSAINDALWKALERGETTHAALKIARFAQLLEEYPAENVCAPRLALRYSHYLGTHADLMPGAEAFLRRLHGQMKIVLVSNGDASSSATDFFGACSRHCWITLSSAAKKASASPIRA